MNFQEILLPQIVYQVIVVFIIIANLLWANFRKEFLNLLEKYEPESWAKLGSSNGYFILSPFKDIKVEAFISKNKWHGFQSTDLKLAAKKAVYAHRLFILMVGLLCLSFFGPLLTNQIS